MTAACGCLDQARITDQVKHDEWHLLVAEQTGIIEGPVNIDTLRIARGLSTTMPSPNDHKKREKDLQSGKSSPGWRREAAR